MNQSFSTKFPWGEETHFIEKLWKMALMQKYVTLHDIKAYRILNGHWELYKLLPLANHQIHCLPKLHTIRGKSDRYKPYQMQQPFIWSGKPYKEPIFRFMPMIPLVSKQEIIITEGYFIMIDGKNIKPEVVDQLAINDGFENTDDFYRWFTKRPFIGEIRHYTCLRY